VLSVDRVSTGYIPRKHQAYLHKKLKRFNVLVCHRRFGKTVFSVNETISKGLRNPRRNPQYAYIAPTFTQAKRVAWDMFKDFTRSIPGVQTNEQELRVDIPRPDRGDRIRFMLLGAENPGSVRGIYLDGVIQDEYAECDPTIWSQVIRPALSDRLGWAIFIGTPKGQNHFYDVHQVALQNQGHDWFQVLLKASETNIILPSELAAAKREMTEEEFEQEFECSFSAALVGAYYGKLIDQAEDEGRICDLAHDRALQVDTFWDLGINDTTAIWFLQQLRTQYRLIDYIENSGEGIEYYVKELQKKRGYVYRDHLFPHDAGARDLSTGVTRIQSFQKLGLRGRVLPRQAVADGIHASRLLLPKCHFDRQRCDRGIRALRNYQKKWDAKNKIWTNKPLHDWSSNGADAFRTMAMGSTDDTVRSDFTNAHKQTQASDYGYDIFGG